jgi:8-oxo-dGTP diphosphatase
MSPIRSTLVYVLRGPEVLLLLRRKPPNRGLLSPPGGKLAPGEDPAAGAARELREETGLEPVRIGLRGTARHAGPGAGEEWLQYLFRVSEFSGALRPACPEGTFAWYPVAALLRGDLPIPAADPIYQSWVLGEEERRFDCLIFHRPDGSVERFRRRWLE